MRIRMEIGEGTLIPNGYGLAYCMDYNRIRIYYPIPFNVFMRIGREVWKQLERGLFRSRYEKEIAKARKVGYEEGRQMAQLNLESDIIKECTELMKSKK